MRIAALILYVPLIALLIVWMVRQDHRKVR